MAWEQIVGYDSIRSALAALPAKPARSAKVAEPSIAELEATNARLLADNERLRQLHKTPPSDPWQPPDEDKPPPEDEVKLFTREQFDGKQIPYKPLQAA